MRHSRLLLAATALAACVGTPGAVQAADGRPAATILGLGVEGAGGTALGAIDDIRIAPDGQVAALMVENGAESLAIPWFQVELGEQTALVPQSDVLRPAPGNPSDWTVGDLLGAQVQVGAEPEWGMVKDVVINRFGEVTQAIVTARTGGDFLVPMTHARIGASGGYMKLTIAAPEAETLRRAQPPGPQFQPVDETPRTTPAAPEEERQRQRLEREVLDWQQQVMRFANQARGDAEREQQARGIHRSFRNLMLQWQKVAQASGPNFETALSHYRTARDDLERQWRGVAG